MSPGLSRGGPAGVPWFRIRAHRHLIVRLAGRMRMHQRALKCTHTCRHDNTKKTPNTSNPDMVLKPVKRSVKGVSINVSASRAMARPRIQGGGVGGGRRKSDDDDDDDDNYDDHGDSDEAPIMLRPVGGPPSCMEAAFLDKRYTLP